MKTDADLPRKTAAGFLFFAVLGFSVTRITGMWMGRVNAPPDKVYWNELAESFLHGRLDLMHPAGHHDLTLYDGKWYVPNPPLPGILMIPWVALLGSAESVNMCIADAVIAGVNAGLLFLMLTLAFETDGGPFYRFSRGTADLYAAGLPCFLFSVPIISGLELPGRCGSSARCWWSPLPCSAAFL